MLALAAAAGAAPDRADVELARHRIEAALVGDQRSVLGRPPIALEKAGHHAIAAAAVPDERAVGREDSRELADHAGVVGGIGEEAERREEVEYGIEAAGPPRRQTAHFAAMVAERAPGAALARVLEHLRRVIEAIDVEAGFGEQVCVAALAARAVENAGARGKSEQLDQARDFRAVALEAEERLVLEEILGIEVRRPPLVGLARQKNTGSRYAPNTSSIAARISYSVQYACAASIRCGITFRFSRHAARSSSRALRQRASSRS